MCKQRLVERLVEVLGRTVSSEEFGFKGVELNAKPL